MVCVVLDDVVVNSASFRSTLGTGFDINDCHLCSPIVSFAQLI
jgi:hypothetical protein